MIAVKLKRLPAPPAVVVAWLFFVFLAGCGLPDTISLEKPAYVDAGPTGLGHASTVLAFRTPAVTTLIQGYTLYYKIYYSSTDFDDEEDESRWFDEGTYININDEMQPGPAIPNQRGYIRVGELGGDKSNYPGFLIADTMPPSTIVYIDFDWELKRGVFDKDSPDPIVTLDPAPATPVDLYKLARGIIDPTDSNDSLRSFVNINGDAVPDLSDWDFDDGSPNDNFFDADIRRKYNLPLTSSVGVMTDFLITGDPFAGSGSAPLELRIGFVVHSYGLDSVDFQILYSKPVYIGSVIYNPLNDTNRTTVTRP